MKEDIYDEYSEDQVRKLYKKRKKLKLKRRFKLFVIFALSFIIGGYFISDLSKVKSISIVGNTSVESSTIEKASSLNKKTTYLFINKGDVEDKIKSLPLIKKANVYYDVLGNVTIEIEESKQVAYCVINGKTYVLDELGSVVETKDKNIKEKLKSFPKLSKFKDLKFLKKFSKEYPQVPDVIKGQTSDIVYSPKKADETRIRFILDNGKELIVRLESMVDVLNKFSFEANMNINSDKCTFDFNGSHVYMSKCKDSK